MWGDKKVLFQCFGDWKGQGGDGGGGLWEGDGRGAWEGLRKVNGGFWKSG